MNLWKAIKKIAKDERKVFIRAKNFPYGRFKLYYHDAPIGGGIRVINIETGDFVNSFPINIMDGWEEVNNE